MIDPRKLRPSELCRLLNSTPLGEVINARQLRRHRDQAGLRIGDGPHVDLLRYVAWLVHLRQKPKPEPAEVSPKSDVLAEAARGAAALGSQGNARHGQAELTRKQEALMAALLTESSYAAAAAAAGVAESTLYRWLNLPAFRAAYRQARRELKQLHTSRIEAALGEMIDTVLAVARSGKRESDRLRAAIAVIDRASGAGRHAEVLDSDPQLPELAALGTADLVKLLSARLQQLDAAELPTGEKSRLTATLADSLLRTIHVDVIDKRLEAIQTVLQGRGGKRR
jgi:transposase-like protein